jgi:hypothetical protein
MNAASLATTPLPLSVLFSQPPVHGLPHSSQSRRDEWDSKCSISQTAVVFVVVFYFLLFSAQKSHVKPQIHLTH